MIHIKDPDSLKIFSGRQSADLALKVCSALNVSLGASNTSNFPDGETLVTLEEDVRGRDCYIILSTCTPVNDNLMELLIFCDCLRRASANKIIPVMPYFGYARQDRKDKGRVPITAKLVANMITAAGADRVIGIDFHAAQLQGFFDIPVDHLSATPVFFEYFAARKESFEGELCFVSPDVGNAKVAEGMANLLGNASIAIVNKKRIDGEQVAADKIIGEVEGKTCIMFDDMISTAGTMCEAAKIVMKHGAKSIIIAATHGVFCGRAIEKILDAPIDEIITTNSIPGGKRILPLGERYVELCISKLLAEAIRRNHNRESVSALFRHTAGTKR